jgi:hypothetical protein
LEDIYATSSSSSSAKKNGDGGSEGEGMALAVRETGASAGAGDGVSSVSSVNNIIRSPAVRTKARAVLMPIAACYNTLGMVFQHYDEFSEAEEAYNKSVRAYAGAGLAESFQAANTLNNFGTMYDDWATAEAESAAAKGGSGSKGVGALQQRALDQAKDKYEASVVILLRNFGRFHPQIISALDNLLSLLTAMGLTKEAASVHKQIEEVEARVERDAERALEHRARLNRLFISDAEEHICRIQWQQQKQQRNKDADAAAAAASATTANAATAAVSNISNIGNALDGTQSLQSHYLYYPAATAAMDVDLEFAGGLGSPIGGGTAAGLRTTGSSAAASRRQQIQQQVRGKYSAPPPSASASVSANAGSEADSGGGDSGSGCLVS